MKIRNHRKNEWVFYPAKGSKLTGLNYRFKYKSHLMKFLNGNFYESLNGAVSLHQNSFGHSGTVRQWYVWYNDWINKGEFRISLRQQDFRGRKFVFKPNKISRKDKKYFAFSEKVISLMCTIADEGVTERRAKRLVGLFYKRGFKNFEPTEDDWRYINGHIGDGIDFYHWSDRCDWLRTKTVIEYFNREGFHLNTSLTK